MDINYKINNFAFKLIYILQIGDTMLNKIKTIFLSISLMMCSFIFAQEVVLGLGAVTDSSAEVTMDTPFDVGGFQFDAVGATMLTAGEGGLAC